MNFDDVLTELGNYGFYQLRLYSLLCLYAIPLSFHSLASVFLAATTKFRCAIPGYDGDTFEILNQTHELFLNASIPRTAEGDFETCHVFKDFRLPTAGDGASQWNATEVRECNRWVYDHSVFSTTIFTEFNLVCSKSGETTLSTVFFMGGFVVGSLVFGALADSIGRKTSFLIANFCTLVAGVSCSFAPNYYVFVAFRFLIGACVLGAFICNYTLGGEVMSPRVRLYAAVFRGLFFSVGYCALAGLAFLIRDWRKLQFVISLTPLWFILYIWLIPESPRWLLSKGRRKEAEEIIHKAEKFNKVTLPTALFDTNRDSGLEQKKVTMLELPRELLRARKLRIRSLIMFFNWLVVSMVYFGLSLNSGNFGGDIYVNFLLGGLVEFPSKLLSLSTQWIGRKASYISGMLLGGIACLCSIFVVLYYESNNAALIVMSLIGKFGSANGFLLVYFWGSELYPTVARNSLIGISSVFARVGAMVAIPIGDLNQYLTGDMAVALPQVIFGSLAIFGTLLTIYLPETKGRKMPETIEDCENSSWGNERPEPEKKTKRKSNPSKQEFAFEDNEVDTYL